jgi:hypothetical protein
MYNLAQYAAFKAFLGVPHLINPTHADYINYENLWEDYLNNIVIPTVNQKKPKRISIIAMESAPGGNVHPHPNYIFNNLMALTRHPEDSYLRAFFNGSHHVYGQHANGLTKLECLQGLINALDVNNQERPILLMDLFASHGIKLNTKKRSLLSGRVHGVLNPLVTHEIQCKLDFIHANLLTTNSLTWDDVHFKFACPPTSMSNEIVNFINVTFPGITIHPININNAGRGVTPSQNTLRDNILLHGF